jgi:hypothetical protein
MFREAISRRSGMPRILPHLPAAGKSELPVNWAATMSRLLSRFRSSAPRPAGTAEGSPSSNWVSFPIGRRFTPARSP